MWRGTQEAEGTGFEYQQAGNSRAGVQIPLSPPEQNEKAAEINKNVEISGFFSVLKCAAILAYRTKNVFC